MSRESIICMLRRIYGCRPLMGMLPLALQCLAYFLSRLGILTVIFRSWGCWLRVVMLLANVDRSIHCSWQMVSGARYSCNKAAAQLVLPWTCPSTSLIYSHTASAAFFNGTPAQLNLLALRRGIGMVAIGTNIKSELKDQGLGTVLCGIVVAAIASSVVAGHNWQDPFILVILPLGTGGFSLLLPPCRPE